MKRGSQPTTGDYDCRSFRSGTFEVCEIVSPDAGTWHILVDYFGGNGGAYQVTAMPFESIGNSKLYGIGSNIGGSSTFYRINDYGTVPSAAVVGDSGTTLFDIAIDPTTGRIYGVYDNTFYELNAITGAATVIGSTGSAEFNSLEFDATGQAYGWSFSGSLYKINKSTGALTLVGPTGFSPGGDLAFDHQGVLYGSTDNALIRIDSGTGTGTQIGSFSFSGAFGLEVDPQGGTMYVGRGSVGSSVAEIYVVNKATARTKLVGSIENVAVGLFGLAFLESPDTSTIFADGFESGGTCKWSSTVSGI